MNGNFFFNAINLKAAVPLCVLIIDMYMAVGCSAQPMLNCVSKKERFMKYFQKSFFAIDSTRLAQYVFRNNSINYVFLTFGFE